MQKQLTPHIHAEVIRKNIHKFIYKDGDLLWSGDFGPRARKHSVAGSIDTHGYLQIKLQGKCVLAHRIIWLMHNPDSLLPDQIDHEDRNRLNNKIENLRASNNTLNQHNASIRIDNKSGCTGVNMLKSGKWQARISLNKTRMYLGTFDTLFKATDAYNCAKEKYHSYDDNVVKLTN